MIRALALLLSLSGCTGLVDLDYNFDDDPCGYEPRECIGGRTLTFVVSRSDVTREVDGRLDGFDLDAFDGPVCNHEDFVAPSGETGIDNQLSGLIEIYEMVLGVDIEEMALDLILDGSNLLIIEVAHVDDLVTDDCVALRQRRAFLPEGVSGDANMDRVLDAGLTLDYRLPNVEDPDACIIDGHVHARFLSTTGALPIGTGEFSTDRGRARVPLAEDRMTGAVFGGSARIEELRESLDEAIVGIVAPQADLDPPPSNRMCGSISYALTFDAIPVTLGELVR